MSVKFQVCPKFRARNSTVNRTHARKRAVSGLVIQYWITSPENDVLRV
jgi:hypothetical protein